MTLIHSDSLLHSQSLGFIHLADTLFALLAREVSDVLTSPATLGTISFHADGPGGKSLTPAYI